MYSSNIHETSRHKCIAELMPSVVLQVCVATWYLRSTAEIRSTGISGVLVPAGVVSFLFFPSSVVQFDSAHPLLNISHEHAKKV